MGVRRNLGAVSPIDGRYFDKCKDLFHFFSEIALIKYRIKVEVEYLIALSKVLKKELEPLKGREKELRKLYSEFELEYAEWIKVKEEEINHDVKAVEYFVKDKLKWMGLESISEFVHFGLTSQDINNTAYPMMWRDALAYMYHPLYSDVYEKLITFALLNVNQPMLARTHGQPATPTTLAKQFDVFLERLDQQYAQLEKIPHCGKFGGATGNMNAHNFVYPHINWHDFAENLLKDAFELTRSHPTTQIEHYDNFAASCHALMRLNTIYIDLCRDMWHYISIEYFVQQVVPGEVGSSAMPHKVNPIDFENAEGNFGLANALLGHFAEKLPISRLQRDLTDSTVMRSIGTALGHIVIAMKSLKKGLSKIEVNKEKINQDLDDHWEVLAEGIQCMLRSINYPEPYEALKKLTRNGEKITKETLHTFIKELEVDESVKQRLLSLTPHNYL